MLPHVWLERGPCCGGQALLQIMQHELLGFPPSTELHFAKVACSFKAFDRAAAPQTRGREQVADFELAGYGRELSVERFLSSCTQRASRRQLKVAGQQAQPQHRGRSTARAEARPS